MKKSFKRILATVLTVVMIMTAAPLTGINIKANALASSGKCGNNVSYTFDSSTGTLTISGIGDMYDYDLDYISPFWNNSSIKNIIIKIGITSIGDHIFEYCDELKSVTIPDSVLSIGVCAFSGCYGLVSITIPNSITSIADSAFSGCKSLKSITIPKGITNIGGWTFCDCESLESIIIPSGVVNIGVWAFGECYSLKSLTIPESVTTISENVLRDCDELKDIYYTGSQSQWNRINISTFNEDLLNATIHYNSPNNITSYKTGDIIEFGYYPQSKVTDSKTIAELDKISKNWISYRYYSGTGNSDGNMKTSDYMKYCDISYNGNKYRAVTFSAYRPSVTEHKLDNNIDYTWQDDNGYYIGNMYYFKYAPLKWRILDPSEGLVMCEKAIDSQAYNNSILFHYNGNNTFSDAFYGDFSKNYYASDWANSSLRVWLNNDFYNTAFTSTEQSQISTTHNENKSTYSSQYDSTNTSDKIFLLSYNEVSNIKYGFNSTSSRQLKSTDYAQCQGCYKNHSWWWLRSPNDSGCVECVDSDGYMNYVSSVNDTDGGVVPAIMLTDIDAAVEAQNKIFIKNKYIADIWLNRRGGEATSESKLVSEILSYSSISSEIYNDLLKNDDFTDSLKGWTTLKSLFDSVDLAKDTLNEKDIYETLILDLLKKASKNNINDSNRIIYDALDIAGDVADNVSKYKKIIFSMSSMVKGSDKVVLDLFKNWKINPKNTETYKKFFSIISEYEKESDSIKKWSDNGFVEGIGAIAEVVSDVSDFYKRVAAYMYITDMSDEMVTLLKEMYKNTSSESFKNAIADVLIGFENENYINLLLTCKLSTDIALSVTDALYDDVSEAIPGYNLLKTSYGVAVTFDDLMFNTSNTLDKFYLIQATYNFIDANKKAINTFKNNYLSSNSETDAASYVYAVKTYNHAYEIDLESAVSFTKAASNEGLINYAKRGVKSLVNLVTGSDLKTSYQSFSESKDNIVKNLDFLFYSLDNSWKFNEEYLQKDFPDVYPVYLTEELSKEVYKPSIASCYIEKSGKTDMEWSVPYNFKASDGQYYPLYGSLWINGIESSETVGTSKTNSNYNSISNAPNPIQFYNRSKFSTFPKTYAIKAYSNTSSGKVYTPTETMKMEKPVKNVSISLSMSEFLRRSGDGVSITVTDNSESVYDYIKYSIYRKTNNSSWTLLKTIDRDFNLRGYNTVFVDDTVSEGNQYTYKVVSSITFDNGVTIKSGDSNEISVNGTKTSPMVNNLRTERISKSTPVLKTRMLKAAPARNTQSGIKISWDTIDNAKQYEIYRMVSYGTVYNLIATVDGKTLSYIDEDVRDAVGYDYLVVPCTVSGANKTYATNVCAQGSMTYASGNVKSVSVDDIEIKYKTSAIITPNVITDGYINYTATYESSNPSVATVDKNGNITTHHKGNTTITCTVTDGYGNTTKDTCTVNVKFQWWQWLIWILLFGFLWY